MRGAFRELRRQFNTILVPHGPRGLVKRVPTVATCAVCVLVGVYVHVLVIIVIYVCYVSIPGVRIGR